MNQPNPPDKPKILIVDDETFNIDVLVDILKDDCQTVVAKSGRQALQRVRQEPRPDLIILDIVMPEMDGFAVCRELKADPATRRIPVIFFSAMDESADEARGLALGAVDYLAKPVSPAIVRARVATQLALQAQNRSLERLVRERTEALEKTQEALREAMGNLMTIQVAPGVFWVQVPEARLNILCGCPGDVVKHLLRQGFIKTISRDGVSFETGPNAILLSDQLVQNGGFANLAEFPVLQMLYRQGMIIPNHPNNTGVRPLLIGSPQQVQAQLEYIHRGNYGLVSKEELLASGVEPEAAETMMRIKLKFAFGSIRTPEAFLDTLEVSDGQPVEIRNGVAIERTAHNRFRFDYRGKTAEVDLNLPPGAAYDPPYPLGRHRFRRRYFAVLHSGEGDGWDMNRPSMGSILMFQGRVYLVDAGPGILASLTALGLDISEVEGIFHTHGHDDHFGGLPALIHSDRRLKYFATPFVRASVAKKFAALMSMDEAMFSRFFEIHDLTVDLWNDCDGLEVMPIYSPHPVETTLFHFRARDGEGYKSYAHWADLSAFGVLDGMVGDGPADIDPAFVADIKRDYLRPADIKKLDVGGGMIHGLADDFSGDPSGRLIMAHIARKLTSEEMEVGSEASFGALEILIHGQQDYLIQAAFGYVRALFPEVPAHQVQLLLNCPIIKVNAGAIFRRAGSVVDHIDLVLAGSVAYIDSASGIRHHLSFGSLIGAHLLFEGALGHEGAYRAVSHCSVMRLPRSLLRAFLESNGLSARLKSLIDKVWFLRRTWLFGEQTNFLSLVDVAQAMEEVSFPSGAEVPLAPGPVLWLVKEGRVRMLARGCVVGLVTIETGDFFGEHAHLSEKDPFSGRFEVVDGATLYRLRSEVLQEIPVVLWKMLERWDKRRRLF